MGRFLAGATSGLLAPASADVTGLIAGRDPRVRIVALVAFAIVVVSLSSFVALGAAVAIAVGLVGVAGLPLARALRRILAVDTFIVFMIVLLPFTVPGEPIFEVLGWPASREGFAKGITIALKASAIVTMATALLGAMDAITLARALGALGMPDRLVHLVLFTVRYVDVLDQEYRRLRTAMKARGFRPRNSRHTYTSFGYLIGMMLVRALERSERILAAMKCRGFSGRLFLDDGYAMRRADFAFAAAFGAMIVVLVGCEVIRVGVV